MRTPNQDAQLLALSNLLLPTLQGGGGCEVCRLPSTVLTIDYGPDYYCDEHAHPMTQHALTSERTERPVAATAWARYARMHNKLLALYP